MNFRHLHDFWRVARYRLLEPAMRFGGTVRIHVRSGKAVALPGELVAHRLDLIVSDAPMPAGSGFKAFNHRLGRSGVSVFAALALRRTSRTGPRHAPHGRTTCHLPADGWTTKAKRIRILARPPDRRLR